MRSFYYIAILFVVCTLAQEAVAQQAQTPRTRRSAENANSGLPELSVRAKARNENQSVNMENVVWLRELYREIDLRKEDNSPLYYPTEPIGNRANLFTTMFKLIADGKLSAYKYEDGKEIFTDRYKLDFEDLLKNHHIMYKRSGTGPNAAFVIEDIDIPGNEVLAYMIKEAYYFDQATGTFGSEVIALCPMLVREGDFGENLRYPLFWVVYSDVRPYLSRSSIMTSDYNNAMTYTTDDFFQLNMYKGDIIKATNMMNRTLAQQYPDSANLKQAQERIEKQLKTFESSLWLPKDTAQVAVKDKKAAKDSDDKKTSTKASRSNASSTKTKSSSTKAAKSSSTPTRSVRRR